ncbi:MAG: helix-turn-helix transcriptional regulator [bacterium]|nr:helix-turn-helix transcriptional regulator [bacterium]
MKLRLEKNDREAIGSRLREIRLFNKLEQTELAVRAGLSQAIISQYENGLTEVSLSFIKFLADNFGISGDWLIFGEGCSPYEKSQKEIQVQLTSPSQVQKGAAKNPYFGVPLVDPRSAACPGKVRTDNISEWELVRFKEAEGRNNLVAIDIKAAWVKNMDSPLHTGGRIIIDRDDKKIRPDAYYAVNTELGKKNPKEAAINAIRRLNLSGARLWFVEDHPQKDFDFIDLKAKERLDDIIVGRVIWIWQKLP